MPAMALYPSYPWPTQNSRLNSFNTACHLRNDIQNAKNLFSFYHLLKRQRSYVQYDENDERSIQRLKSSDFEIDYIIYLSLVFTTFIITHYIHFFCNFINIRIVQNPCAIIFIDIMFKKIVFIA